MAKRSRPPKGLDYWKMTVRISEKHSKIVGQYCRDHFKPEDSTVIRDAIELLGDTIEMLDIIETSICNSHDIAKLNER